MRLLVSVSDAAEAEAALAGGADIIDAKDPWDGALGAVRLAVFRDICRAVGDARPVSAALGDAAADAAAISDLAAAYTEAGASFVKVGFGGAGDAASATVLLRAAVTGAAAARRLSPSGRGAVVAAAFADRAHPLSPAALIECAAAEGAAGVLLDTSDKSGPGLLRLMPAAAIAAWLRAAADAGLQAALAGQLTFDDIPRARDLGAEIVGVRGAACDAGRTGRIVATRVRALKRQLEGRMAQAGP